MIQLILFFILIAIIIFSLLAIMKVGEIFWRIAFCIYDFSKTFFNKHGIKLPPFITHLCANSKSDV